MNEPQYAGFWLRFGATIIDSVIFGLILMVPLALITVKATGSMKPWCTASGMCC
ncbi:RDD family protein [Halopseudomonas pachastrellae]|nr:RDD family protein [Halopseudomonas pachastrellae]